MIIAEDYPFDEPTVVCEFNSSIFASKTTAELFCKHLNSIYQVHKLAELADWKSGLAFGLLENMMQRNNSNTRMECQKALSDLLFGSKKADLVKHKLFEITRNGHKWSLLSISWNLYIQRLENQRIELAMKINRRTDDGYMDDIPF